MADPHQRGSRANRRTCSGTQTKEQQATAAHPAAGGSTGARRAGKRASNENLRVRNRKHHHYRQPRQVDRERQYAGYRHDECRHPAIRLYQIRQRNVGMEGVQQPGGQENHLGYLYPPRLLFRPYGLRFQRAIGQLPQKPHHHNIEGGTL